MPTAIPTILNVNLGNQCILSDNIMDSNAIKNNH